MQRFKRNCLHMTKDGRVLLAHWCLHWCVSIGWVEPVKARAAPGNGTPQQILDSCLASPPLEYLYLLFEEGQGSLAGRGMMVLIGTPGVWQREVHFPMEVPCHLEHVFSLMSTDQ